MSEEKILKSEELTEEDLDEVAGGTYKQVRDDLNFFNSVMPGKLPVPSAGDSWKERMESLSNMYNGVAGAWGEFGVEAKLGLRLNNKYSIGGHEVTPDQARIHVLRQLKHRG